MKYAMAVILICIFATTYTQTQEQSSYFTEKGSMWFGGTGLLSSIARRNFNDRTNGISLSPIFRYFPLDYIFIGPSLRYSYHRTGEESKSYSYGLGGEIGYAEINKKLHAVGYLKARLSYEAYERDYSEYGRTNDDGVFSQISIGAVFPIKKIIWINIEPGFFYETQYHRNGVSLSFGFSMMNKKALVTVLSN